MSDETQRGLEYYPEDIQYLEEEGIHIDPTTGKRTYPSWYHRAIPDIIHPGDVEMAEVRPTDHDKRVRRVIETHIHQQGYDLREWLKTKVLIDALKECFGLNHREAYKMLYRIWCAGLVKRTGRVDPRSNRASHQSWFIGGDNLANSP